MFASLSKLSRMGADVYWDAAHVLVATLRIFALTSSSIQENRESALDRRSQNVFQAWFTQSALVCSQCYVVKSNPPPTAGLLISTRMQRTTCPV